MILIDHVQTYGWEAAIRGMRNPMNSWAKSDSVVDMTGACLGKNDLDLMARLVKSGPDHRKFLRMIGVSMDITAPMYWWAEFDTYKVGTVRNSCSKMHKLLAKPFVQSDFSFDHVIGSTYMTTVNLVTELNDLRDYWLKLEGAGQEEKRKEVWYSILQLLPESYNQKATVTANYEVMRNIYHARRDHKLDEWHVFCRRIELLPNAAQLITDKEENP